MPRGSQRTGLTGRNPHPPPTPRQPARSLQRAAPTGPIGARRLVDAGEQGESPPFLFVLETSFYVSGVSLQLVLPSRARGGRD